MHGPALATMLGALVTYMNEQGLSEKDLPQLLAAKPTFGHLDLRELVKRLKDIADAWKRHELRVTEASKKMAAGNADLSDMPLFSGREPANAPTDGPVGDSTMKHSGARSDTFGHPREVA